MSHDPAPRYRVTVHELQHGKTTKIIDAYGSGFITATATLDDDILEVHFGQGRTRDLQQHIASAIVEEYSPRRRR